MTSDLHKRAVSLKERIELAKYNDVPVMLLQLSAWTKRRENVGVLWSCGLMDLMIDVIAYDYLKVADHWKTAAKISTITVDACQIQRAEPPEKATEICLNLVTLLCNVQKEIRIASVGEDKTTKLDLESSFSTVCNSLASFCSTHRAVIAKCIASFANNDLLDFVPKIYSPQMDRSLVNCVYEISRHNPVSALDPTTSRKPFNIQEKLIRRLTSGSDPEVSRLVVEMLLSCIEKSPLSLGLFRKKFRDLPIVLRKWMGKGFDRSLLKFVRYLEKESTETVMLERNQKNAAKIQALWRGHKTRGRLTKMKCGFTALQRLFRWRKFGRQLNDRIHPKVNERKLESDQRICQKSREYQKKRFNAIAGLHPSLVDRFLAEEAGLWATRIQSFYRGYKARRKIEKLKHDMIIDRAAKIIQTAMKRWLEVRKRIKGRLQTWPGLDEQRREQLQRIIDNWNDEIKEIPDSMSYERQKEVHDKAQNLLAQHMVGLSDQMAFYQQCQATMAKVKLDIDLLESAPKLTDVDTKNLIIFRSHSTSVRSLAAKYHNNNIMKTKQPWWKLLADQDDDFI